VRTRHIGLMSILSILFCGCSGTIPLSDNRERLSVRFSATDMTRTGTDSALASAVASTLAQECLYVMRYIPSTAWNNESWELEIASNPFRSADDGASGAVSIAGVLERRDYGPASPERLAGLEGFTLLGGRGVRPSKFGTREDEYVSSVQCRVASDSGNRFLVRHARVADVRSTTRSDLDKQVLDDIAGDMLFTLAEALAKTGRIDFKTHRERGYTPQSGLSRLHEMQMKCGSRPPSAAAGTRAVQW